jgi:hypothetical protein
MPAVAKEHSMAKRPHDKDVLDVLSNFIAHNKGSPVILGVVLAVVGLALNCFPSLAHRSDVWGWVVHSHVFLYLGVIVGLLGILIGDAL